MSAKEIWEQLGQRVQQAIEADRKKPGGMTFGAHGRLGLAELRQAVALGGSVTEQTQTPLGMYGTVTPGEVSAARQESTVHGPEVDAEAVEQSTSDRGDPVQSARLRAAAQADATKGQTGQGRDK